MKGYFVPLDKINGLQCASIERLVDRARGAHWTNIDMRINGANEHFEADWIKHMLVLPEVDDQTAALMELAELRKKVRQYEKYFAEHVAQQQGYGAQQEERAKS
jgi:hypothetical protein